METAEVIVIGSGIGELCRTGLLAKAGVKVLTVEAHSKPGGAAHIVSIDDIRNTIDLLQKM